jgi:hypothetical protein
LEELLLLVLLCLVVLMELSLDILNALSQESSLIVRSLSVGLDASNLELSLIQNRLGINDITLDCVALGSHIGILSLQLLQFTL